MRCSDKKSIFVIFGSLSRRSSGDVRYLRKSVIATDPSSEAIEQGKLGVFVTLQLWERDAV